MVSVIRLITLALWFGGGLFLAAVGTPAAFAGAPDRLTAGNIAGLMLSRWHYVSLIAPAILLVLEWPEGFRRTARTVLLVVAIAAAAAQTGVDLRLRAMRASVPGGVSSLESGDPLRRQFGALHGVSATLFGIELLCALSILVITGREIEHSTRHQLRD